MLQKINKNCKMYLSSSHPGINTSPQPPVEEHHSKSKRFLETTQISPKLHYDGDESDLGGDYDDPEFDPEEDEIPLLHHHHRFHRSSLPDLMGTSFLSTSTHSLHRDRDQGVEEGEAKAAAGDPILLTSDSPLLRRKKRRKRKSEGEMEVVEISQAQRGGGGGECPLSITKSSLGPAFLASTPLVPSTSLPPLMEIPPLRAHWDLANSIGKRRGVCGSSVDMSLPQISGSGTESPHSATSYLDVTLFALFYYSDQFDDWVLDDKAAKGFPDRNSKEVRTLLRKEVLYSLRTSYFCPSFSIGRLVKSVFHPLPQPSYTLEFSRFFRHFLEKVLTLPETAHYTNGVSKLIHVLKDAKDSKPRSGSASAAGTTVQALFEQSLGDLKLLSIPQPGLFLAVENPIVVPHPVILPNIQLDFSRTLIQLSDEDETEDENEEKVEELVHPKMKIQKNSKAGTDKDPQICKWLRSLCTVVYEYLHNLAEHLPTYGIESGNLNPSFLFSDSIIGDEEARSRRSLQSERPESVALGLEYENGIEIEESLRRRNRNKNKPKNKGKLTIGLDLMAVVCLEEAPTSYQYQYSVFVRCGQNPRRGWASWVHFLPCDRGTPVVKRVEDLGKWLSRLEKKPEKIKSWKGVPSEVKKLLTHSTFFIYTPKPCYESQNTLFSIRNSLSFVNE